MLKVTYVEYYPFNVLEKFNRKIQNILLRSAVKVQGTATSCFCFSAEKHLSLVAAQQLGSAVNSQKRRLSGRKLYHITNQTEEWNMICKEETVYYLQQLP